MREWRELTKDIADALYEGKEITVDGKKHTINPDESGQGWVFFKNIDSNSNVKGHLVIDATNKNKEAISETIINAASTISSND